MSTAAAQTWPTNTRTSASTQTGEWTVHETVRSPDPLSYQYDVLVSRLKQMRREGRAPTIAIVSSTPGAGVSTVAKNLTGRMNAGARARRTEDVTVSLPAGEVTGPSDSVGQFISRIFKQHRDSLEYVFDPGLEEPGYHHEPAAGFEDCLLTARSMFRMVLIECRPLRKSADIASVALLVDAVLIVVEANKTTRAQAERLANTIHTAGGNVMGYVLNKRTFPVPSSVYQIFEKAGLI